MHVMPLINAGMHCVMVAGPHMSPVLKSRYLVQFQNVAVIEIIHAIVVDLLTRLMKDVSIRKC